MHGPDVSDIGRTALRGADVCVCVSAAQVALPINEARRYSQEWTEKGRAAKEEKERRKSG